MKIIGIVGTRTRDSQYDYKLVKEAFDSIFVDGDGITSGLCNKGADRFALMLWHIYHIPDEKIFWYPPDYEKHGNKASFIRNSLIAQKADVLIACVSEDRTGGTEDTIRKFKKFHPDRKLIIV